MSGRSRRVVQNRAAASVAAALEKLNAAKSGASKRLDTLELKEEEAVYDVVDEDSYAQLVTKRRIEAGAPRHHRCSRARCAPAYLGMSASIARHTTTRVWRSSSMCR